MRKNLNILFLISLFSFMILNVAATEPATPKMVMVCVFSEDSFYGKWTKLIYTEAFERIGKKLVYKHYPAKRCTLMSEKGRAGGELARVHDYRTDSLVRIEESPFSIRLAAVAVDSSIKLDGWESLRETDYKVECIRGFQRLHDNLKGIVTSQNLSEITTISQGLKKLAIGRTDIFIDLEGRIVKALKSDEFKNSGIKMIGIMEEKIVHAYLHKKHRASVPKLSEVLKKMKEEGLIEKYKTMAEE